MAFANVLLYAFNRGLAALRALARVDLKRLALSAETMENWIPSSLGSMMLRPGLKYIGTTNDNNQAIFIPFVFSKSDTALIELTNTVARVWVNESVITIGSVSTAVTNGNFDTNLNNWTDADETGATSQWVTGGYMGLTGTEFNRAIRRQQVTVAAGDQNDEHFLKVIIERGPVTLRVGSSSGGDEYVSETELGTGTFFFAFTPTGDFHIELSAKRKYEALVTSINVASSGDMEITTPWTTADLDLIRWTQSADVVYAIAEGYQQRKIQRHGTRSWGICKYEPEDGPFRLINIGTTTITPSATTGDITLTASRGIFDSEHVGGLFRLTSIGQSVTVAAAGAGQFSNSIRVTGIGSARQFSITITGTWTATVTLQRSVGEEGSWTDVTTFTVNTTTTHSDGLDNQIIYYRIGIDTGDYTSGTANATLTFSSGGITGVVKIKSFSSENSVGAIVLKELGGTSATADWSESVWSDFRGYPGAVDFYEGRLWQAGKNWIVGSVSDAFESFDDEIEGDSAPIIRTIGSGPVDTINSILGLQRLIIFAQSREISVRSSNFDEPLTPTNFNLKDASTQGSYQSQAVKIDSRAVYIQGGQQRIYELFYDVEAQDYASNDLTVINPDLGGTGFIRLAVQRQPDTRIHCIRSDGTVAILLRNQIENIICWVNFETDGTVEDAFVLPGTEEDTVYYVVNRSIGGTKRYLEKWALESECEGGTLNKQADSFLQFSQAASSTVSGLTHLEGKSVVVWADGKCLRDTADPPLAQTFTVSSGAITLTNAGASYSATTGIVGLPYTAQYKSAKLAFAANLGTALGQKKRVDSISLILQNTHHRGIRFGRDFDNLTSLPQVVNGSTVAEDTVHAVLDGQETAFNGTISEDSRVCLEAKAPRPATVLASVLSLTTMG